MIMTTCFSDHTLHHRRILILYDRLSKQTVVSRDMPSMEDILPGLTRASPTEGAPAAIPAAPLLGEGDAIEEFNVMTHIINIHHTTTEHQKTKCKQTHLKHNVRIISI